MEMPSANDVIWQEFEQTNRDLVQVRSIVADAARQLGGGFKEVIKESKAQQSVLVNLLSHVDSGAESGSNLGAFVANSEALVGRVASDLEESSKRTLEFVEQLSGIDKAFGKLTTFAKSILEVSENIRVLALNANLVATRAGDAGRGFAVVAIAVRELSVRYGALTEEVRENVDLARRSLTDTMVKAKAAAETDQITVQGARAEMHRLQLATSTLRREMGETLQRAHEMGESIQRGVSCCLVGFQFDDLVGQICEASQKRMVACQSLKHAEQCDSIERSGSGGLGAVRALAELQSLQHRSVQQCSLDVGDVEFF